MKKEILEILKFYKANIELCDLENIADQIIKLAENEEQRILRNILDDMDGVYPEYHYDIVENKLEYYNND